MSLFTSHLKRKSERHARWNALMANAPEALTVALDARFRASDRAAQIVGIHEDSVQVAVSLAPVALAVPTTNYGLAPDGTPILRQATKTELTEWYRQYVASQVLLVAEDCFGAGPLLASVSVVASYDGMPVLTARLHRAALDRADWGSRPWDVLTEADVALRWSLDGLDSELQPSD